jgi:hypothetical protein
VIQENTHQRDKKKEEIHHQEDIEVHIEDIVHLQGNTKEVLKEKEKEVQKKEKEEV